MEKIQFVTDDNEVVDFYILEETRINGINYILVTDSEDDEEAEAYILKDTSSEESIEASYEFVEDDNELSAVGKVFEELLEDIDLEK
jgi:hypothetical protein